MSYVFVAIVAGLAGGAALGYWLSSMFSDRLSAQSVEPRFVQAFSWVGALLALLPALFLSIVAGGSLGGGWGEAAAATVGLNGVGVPLGLAVGVAAVLGGVLAVGALVGGLVGKVLANSRGKRRGP